MPRRAQQAGDKLAADIVAGSARDGMPVTCRFRWLGECERFASIIAAKVPVPMLGHREAAL